MDTFIAQGFATIDFNAADADAAGVLRAQLEKLGKPISHYDILIAAQARRRGATLVTANMGEFDRVPDLKVKDWSRD